jgi:hypothetical protein
MMAAVLVVPVVPVVPVPSQVAPVVHGVDSRRSQR